MIFQKNILLTGLMLCALCTGFLAHADANPVQEEGIKTYSFGIVPQFGQRKMFRIWRPILDLLEQKTGFKFNIVGSSKIPVFESKFMAGKYDFAYMNPYHVLKANSTQKYVPLVRDGGRVLQGVLVVRKDSGIESVDELQGKEVAFPSPNALGASLLMRADLLKLHNVSVIPRYVQTHSATYLHVALRDTAAGGGVMGTLRAQKEAVRDNLKIIYKTRRMSPHPIAVHPRVPEQDREKVTQALLEIASTEQGKALFAAVPIKKAIRASMDDYTEMKSWGLDEFYVN